MVLITPNSNKQDKQDSSNPNAGGASSPPPAQNDAFNAAPPSGQPQDWTSFFSQFGRGGGFGGGRGGGGRGWGGRGGGRGGWGGHGASWQEFFRPETVSLEDGELGAGPRGHHHHGPPPPPGQHQPWWAGRNSPYPDPSLAPEAPSFGPGADAPGFAGFFGRNFGGDPTAHFGDGSMHGGPGFGHHHRGGRFGFGNHHGRGGPGFGGRGGLRGGWRGGWPGHHPGHGFVFPRLDIYKKGNTYTVQVDLPGLQKQSVDISVTDGVLTISGEFPSDKPSSGGGGGGEDPFDEYDGYDVFDNDGEEVLMESATLKDDNDDDEEGHYIRRERLSGKFKRCVRLPSWVDVDSIQASMAEGVLTLVIEKPAPEEPSSSTRKLKIN